MERGTAMRSALMNTPGEGAIPFTGALHDPVGLFDALQIQYALVGGVAAIYYGRARFTEDFDFVAVTGHREALERNPDAMKQFGFDPACTWELYHRDHPTDTNR
jgi:hypothetical protein